MKSLSRREFFQHLSLRTQDGSSPLEVKKIFESTTPLAITSDNHHQKSDEWIAVGRSFEMTPGAIVRSQVAGKSILLKSNGDGIWAINDAGLGVALRSGFGGAIFANLGVEWPPFRVLSHATGEPMDLPQVVNHEGGRR